MRNYLVGLSLIALIAFPPGPSNATDDDEKSPTAIEIFDERIMPIFRSSEPSSCVQCHLSSVDLKNYIIPPHEKTFVSLRDQELIDLENPQQSKILELIRMGDRDLDTGAKLIHEKMRKAEYEAFEAWIKMCCADATLRDLPPLPESERARPASPDPVIRHARKSRLVDSFERNVWSQRLRCFPCHTPHEIKPGMRGYQAALKKMKEFTGQYDQAMLDRLAFFRETPEATMQNWIDRSATTLDGQLPMINMSDAANSLVVQKPISRLPKRDADGNFLEPSYDLPVSHMGGIKMHPDDQSYKSFIAWIEDYANVVGGEYTSVDELPADNWFPTDIVLRLSQTPDDWAVGTPVQLFVHPWSKDQQTWDEHPVAFTQGTVTPRHMVNGALFMLFGEDERPRQWVREESTLARGKYLIKVFVDRSGLIASDPALLLGAENFAGQAELSNARWRKGFPKAEIVSSKSLSGGKP